MRAFHCESPKCRTDLSTFSKTYYLDSPQAPCPKCGISGYLVMCDVIHFLVRDSHGGVTFGGGKLRHRFLCSKANRDFKLFPPGHPKHPNLYTMTPRGVTCEDCLIEFGAKLINAERITRK